MAQIRGIRVTPAQEIVYRSLKQLRTASDQALVAYVQHVKGGHLSSSGIRTRRRELEDAGLVKFTGKRVPTASGRTTRLFRAV